MEKKRGGGANTGRGGDPSGGRGGRGGRGGGGRGMGAMDPTFNSPDYVRDPHERTPMPETEWTTEMRDIYEEIISRLDEKIEEDIIENLTPKQGDIVLIQLLFMKVVAHRNRAGDKDDAMINKNLRVLHRSLLLDALNRNSAFNEVLKIIKNGKYDRIVIGSTPASLSDLYTQAGRQSVYEQVDEEEKKERIITNMLTPHLIRNYTNTNKLFEVIKGLHKNSVGTVRKLAMERNAMMRYMYIEGGLSTRYVPITVSEQLPTPISNDDNDDDNFDYEDDEEDFNAQEMNEGSQNDGLDDTKADNANDNPTENEATQREENENENDTKPAATRTTEEEIAAYQIGLEQPNSVIKLDKNKLGSMKENDIKKHLTEKLGPYLRAHYGEYSDELMEVIIKENSFRIVGLIEETKALKQFAKDNGFEPVLKIDDTSPRKVRGNHPFASNIMRKFSIECTKQNMGMRRPYGVTVDALKLLFKAVRDINQHEICLVPCNPHSILPMIWDLELIEDEQRKLTGNYIDNIEAYAWNDKNVWTFTVATTIDLHYMIQKNYNRDIMGNGGLQVGLKQLEVILKVIDISTSMKEPVAIISKGSKYDDNNRCIEELISRLSEQGQRDYEKSQFEIEWRKVSDPSDDNIYAMMGVIMCDRDVYDTLANDLILLNNSKDIAIHPHTGRWVLYRGRDDDRQPFTMKAGIKNQIEHRNQQEIITLSGMALFDL